MFFNKIFMIGNLTGEPELKQTGRGSVCTFSIASNRVYTVNNGERREETCFVGVTVWGKQGESCARYLTKGRAVLVEGRLSYQTWKNEYGETRSRHEIIAEHINFLSGGSQGDGTHEQQ